jgi:hypothetical protein
MIGILLKKQNDINTMIKLFKILLLSLSALLLLSFLGVLAFWVNNSMYLGSADQYNMEYLRKNKQLIALQNKNAFVTEALFNEAFYDNQVFLLGENHGLADVQKLDQQLFIHLNQKAGVRHYIAEIDSLRATQLNTFLTAPQKDTSLLKQVVLSIKNRIPQQSGKELYQKWSDLYDYNQELAANRKIVVLGIDTDFDANATTISRDSSMFLNFRQLVATHSLENEKFYGLFGYTHVLQGSIGEGGFRPFAAKLKYARLPYASSIKSIVCYNLESEVYFPANGQIPAPEDEKTTLLNANGPLLVVQGIRDPQQVTEKNTVTLFNLDAENSPYRTSQLLAGVKVNFFGGNILPHSHNQSTTDLFQYMILLRNAKAVTKFS